MFGLPLELLAGADGLTRVITSPHIQKTGLALAGFHEYLKPGRVLIFGESEIRYLESLDTDGAREGAAPGSHARFPVRPHHRRLRPRRRSWSLKPERARLPLLQDARADADRDRQADVDARGLARRADRDACRAHGHPRPRRADRRRERHRQERVRARPDRPRASARRRRHRGDPAARRNDPHRHLPGADAAPHGAARARASSTSRSCSASRRRGRPSASSSSCSSNAGSRAASTSGWASTTSSTRSSG